jgi:hypothetical protein
MHINGNGHVLLAQVQLYSPEPLVDSRCLGCLVT